MFLGNIRQENILNDILEQEKRLSKPIKTRSQKSRKIEIFPKGLIHGFGPKMAIYSNFFFLGNIGWELSIMIFWNEKTPF